MKSLQFGIIKTPRIPIRYRRSVVLVVAEPAVVLPDSLPVGCSRNGNKSTVFHKHPVAWEAESLFRCWPFEAMRYRLSNHERWAKPRDFWVHAYADSRLHNVQNSNMPLLQSTGALALGLLRKVIFLGKAGAAIDINTRGDQWLRMQGRGYPPILLRPDSCLKPTTLESNKERLSKAIQGM